MSKKILLVEDEALIAMSQAKVLKKHEYEVVTAYSGEKAIEAVDSDPEISLILMDIDLGKGMDGTEAAQEILKKQELPIVFLTSHSEKEYVDRVKKITNYGYVLKSSGEFVLVESINMAFHLYEAHKELQNQKEDLQSAIFQQEKAKKAYQRIFNLTPALFCIAGTDGYFKELNPEWEKTLGYTLEELKSKPLTDFIHPDDIEPTQHEIEKQTSGSETAYFINRYYHKDGSYRYLEWNALPSEEGYLYASAKDVTEQIHKDEELKKSEEKYRLLFQYSNDAIFVHEIGSDKLPGRIIEVNEQACRLLQYSREELLQMSIIDITAEENQSLLRSRAKELVEKKHFTFVSEDMRRDGVLIPVEVSAYSYSEGGRDFVVSSIRDITERKRLEKELKSNTDFMEDILDNMHDLVSLTDLAGNFVFVGKSHKILGYEPIDLIGSNVMEIVHPDDYSYVEKEFHNFLLSKENKKIEYRCKRSDGSYLWFETVGKILPDESGNPGNIIFSTRDISERKQIENALKESEKKYRLITENASDMIIQVDERLRPIYISPSVAESLGYTLEDIADANVLEFVPPEDQKSLAKLIEKKIEKNEKKLVHSHRIYTKSGELRWMETRARLTYDVKGRFKGAIYADRDITDIRKLEQVNEERRQLLEAILEANPNAVFTLDSKNRITEWNREAEKLLHYTRKEVLGCNIDEIVGREDDIVYEEVLSFSKRTLSGEAVPPTETVRFTKEGKALPLIIAGSPIIVDGTFTGVVVTYTDISRLKQKEKEVETLLGEKEQLLHEVHHRIKNHMNTIYSIISLRASHIDNLQTRDVLEEVQDKVNLMQNIYQSLYTGKDVGTIRISSYLDPVIHDIQSAYIDNQTISISTDIQAIEVTSKQSFPIGIIITELITNSIKYAFDESGEGKIHISIHKDKENTDFLYIEVADNGKGIPPEIVENGEYGFGLTLVEGYTKQFDGTMSISTEEGTTVRVVLELE
ncbi:MAG: PAS domain S-box protein [Spirochaetales bacterium]|nr:PAS domain S-box protein [Spirochaetales bacterium]